MVGGLRWVELGSGLQGWGGSDGVWVMSRDWALGAGGRGWASACRPSGWCGLGPTNAVFVVGQVGAGEAILSWERRGCNVFSLG